MKHVLPRFKSPPPIRRGERADMHMYSMNRRYGNNSSVVEVDDAVEDEAEASVEELAFCCCCCFCGCVVDDTEITAFANMKK